MPHYFKKVNSFPSCENIVPHSSKHGGDGTTTLKTNPCELSQAVKAQVCIQDYVA